MFQPDLLVRPRRTRVWLVVQPAQHRRVRLGATAPRSLVWSFADSDISLDPHHDEGQSVEAVRLQQQICLSVSVSERLCMMYCADGSRRGLLSLPFSGGRLGRSSCTRVSSHYNFGSPQALECRTVLGRIDFRNGVTDIVPYERPAITRTG